MFVCPPPPSLHPPGLNRARLQRSSGASSGWVRLRSHRIRCLVKKLGCHDGKMKVEPDSTSPSEACALVRVCTCVHSPAVETLTRARIHQSGLSPPDAPKVASGSGHQLLGPAGFGHQGSGGWWGGLAYRHKPACVHVYKGRKRKEASGQATVAPGGGGQSERDNGRSGTAAVGAAASPPH